MTMKQENASSASPKNLEHASEMIATSSTEPCTPPSNKKRKSKGSSSSRSKKTKGSPRPVVLSEDAKQTLCIPDVLYEIFSYLVFPDIVHRIMLVNKTWRTITRDLNKLWADFTLFHWPDVSLTVELQRESSVETFKYFYTHNCYECCKSLKKESKVVTLNSRTGCTIKLCEYCAYEAPYSERKLLTKSRIYELLKLNNKDIVDLPYREGYSYTYRVETTNLCLKNCYHKALSKYFPKGGIEANNQRLRAIAEKKRKTIEKARTERREELTEALEAEGLKLRCDSRLCAAYIEGTCGQSLEQVVQTMKEMQFYHVTISHFVQAAFDEMEDEFRDMRREMRPFHEAFVF